MPLTKVSLEMLQEPPEVVEDTAITLRPTSGDRLADFLAAYAEAYDTGKALALVGGTYDLSARLDLYERANVRPPPILPIGDVILRATGDQATIVRVTPDAGESARPIVFGSAFGTAANPITLRGRC